MRGHTRAIDISVSYYHHPEINVAIDWEGEFFDSICWLDSFPEAVEGGFQENSLLPEYRTIQPDLESLWRTVIFSDFKKWYESKLLQSDLLVLWKSQPAGMTSARLTTFETRKELEGDFIAIPLRGY